MRLLIDMGAIESRILGRLAPLLVLLGGAKGDKGDKGEPGAQGPEGRPSCFPGGSIDGGELGSSLARYLALPVGAPVASTDDAWRIRVAPGTRWRVRIAVKGTIPVGETLTAAIYQAATCYGTYGVIDGSQWPIDNFDGGNPEKTGEAVTASEDTPWLCVGAVYTDGTPYANPVWIGLEPA